MASFTHTLGTPTESWLPLLRDANATPDSPDQTPMMADDAPLPSQTLNSINFIKTQFLHVCLFLINSFLDSFLINLLLSTRATDSPGQAPIMADETHLQSQKLNSIDRMVVLQNNNLTEGVTINIFSNDCTGSMNKLERVIPSGSTTAHRLRASVGQVAGSS
ncbi:uncharacterized protein EDB91DRAFT_1252599 [Suillus paluster]|uniref:uncharacterized protein n=1 Tax=Suillus paluster TaxID=48578 RepID=UPI001B864E8C|nr:uncharacterized protein EDB91DRAFT_1252599 [Suillus paluster]KAG1730522.1 hypothetical protein EDB91DRAFT_1252599 [Suillus paluster]